MKTQIHRWMDFNRSRLTPEQIELLEETIAYIKPELYQMPRREEDQKRKEELLDRSFRLFTREEMACATMMSAPKIPSV